MESFTAFIDASDMDEKVKCRLEFEKNTNRKNRCSIKIYDAKQRYFNNSLLPNSYDYYYKLYNDKQLTLTCKYEPVCEHSGNFIEVYYELNGNTMICCRNTRY